MRYFFLLNTYFYGNLSLMRKILFAVLPVLFCYACKSGSKSLRGSEKVDFTEMSSVFPDLKLPFKAADTDINKIADTTVISYFVMKQFVPDSVMLKIAGKDSASTEIHPVGKITQKTENYLLANVSIKNNTSLIAFLFDTKENKYLSSIELLKNKYTDGYQHELSITSEPTFMLSRQKFNKSRELVYTRNGFAYNTAANEFMKVVNDSNEGGGSDSIINPIDTLASTFKYSGDYVKNKRNFISLRDGASSGKYIFFIHFENSSGCEGELKGILQMTDEKHGLYTENGDICVIDFILSENSIKVKEQNNCGNHRGIQCYFNDSYTRVKTKKKETETKQRKK